MASLTVCIPTLCIKKTGLQRSVTEMISSWSPSFHLLSFSVHLFRSREGDKRSHRIVHLKATVSKGGLQRGACVLDVDTGKRSEDDRVGVQRDGLSWRSKKKAGGDFSRMPLSRRVSSFHLIPPWTLGSHWTDEAVLTFEQDGLCFFGKPRLLPPTLLAVWNPQAHTVGASARHTRLARLFGLIRKEGCGHEASQTVQGRIQVGSNQEGPDGGHLRFDRVVNSDFLNPTWWEQTEWWGSSRPSALNLSFEIRFLTWFDGEWRGAVEYSSKEKRRGGEWKLFFFKKKKYWPIKTHSTATMPAEPFCWMDPYRKWAFLTVWETREIHLTIDREWKRRGFSLLLLV